ncbi:hypothetical protein JOB18_043231 [Solea senegalensis]|uniref:Coiled-coil domain-containing protein 189 n=2 Tax=Solea senegalensis TaxID=28829 RepID=A0AAV6RQI9_SOLSE|nr:hypothetical protein JOB18_043231 [Solea senegalensis]
MCCIGVGRGAALMCRFGVHLTQVPCALKAKVMLWTDVSYHDMEEIDKVHSMPDLERVLCSVLRIDLAEPKRGVLLELFVQTVLFCRENHFKKEQTSALLSIIKSIHEANIETPLNNMKQCFKYSNELLLRHSVRRPPFSISLFNSTEADCVLKYIHHSYMRHCKLYKYIFTPQVKLDMTFTYNETEGHEDSSDSDEAAQETDNAAATPETSNRDQEEAAVGHKSELRALIEKEVREQMTLASRQLDERMKEIANQHKKTVDPLQSAHKAKK